MTERQESSEPEGRYRIGTVAHLTGLHPHTIRAWERRYGAVTPVRTDGGTRQYTEDDVTRLQLLRALTARGESISALASLPVDALRDRLGRIHQLTPGEGRPASGPGAPLRVAILDGRIPEQIRANAADMARLRVVLAEAKPERFVGRLSSTAADVLVLGYGCLGPDPVETLTACLELTDAELVVVLYEFAPRKTLSQLARRGARLVKGPIGVAALERSLFEQLTSPAGARSAAPEAPAMPAAAGDEPERIFSDEQLARLREISTGIDCECPNHVSSLIAHLLEFERYSRDCESRDAEDAALHASLARGTAEARANLERLLVRVCEHDQIRL